MAKHPDLSQPFSVHPFAYASNTDPATDGSIDLAPWKAWITPSSSNLLKVRNAANTAWEDVSIGGTAAAPSFGSNSTSVTTYNDNAGTLAAANAHHHIGVTSIAHTSNTFTGRVTLTAAGTLGITSPTPGTFQFSATGGAAGGGAATPAASARYIRTAGDYSTASTTFVDVDATNMALVITTGAKRVMVGFVGSTYNSAANGHVAMSVAVDGVDQGDATNGIGAFNSQHATVSESMNNSFVYLTDTLTAGSHTFKLRFKALTAGTATINGASPSCEFWVAELI